MVGVGVADFAQDNELASPLASGHELVRCRPRLCSSASCARARACSGVVGTMGMLMVVGHVCALVSGVLRRICIGTSSAKNRGKAALGPGPRGRPEGEGVLDEERSRSLRAACTAASDSSFSSDRNCLFRSEGGGVVSSRRRRVEGGGEEREGDLGPDCRLATNRPA